MRMHIDTVKLYDTLTSLAKDVGGSTCCCEASEYAGEVNGRVIVVSVMTKEEAEEQGMLPPDNKPLIVI